MTSERVDPAAITVWCWQCMIATLLATVAAAVALFPVGSSLWVLTASLVAMIGLLLSWLWPRTYYRHLSYGVDATGIMIQRGVLWRSHIALPRVRIQHTDVSQGPLQRRFGIGTLRLYTAGSRHTMIELSGLAHADAIALRDALLAESASSGV
jgi:membrane protein YdbS with pleckstrin-like domain